MLPRGGPSTDDEKRPRAAHGHPGGAALESAELERKPPHAAGEVARVTGSDREVCRRRILRSDRGRGSLPPKMRLKRLVLSPQRVKTRRLAAERHGHWSDIRRTLRASLKTGRGCDG